MGFHKAIAKRLRAGNKIGRAGFGAAKGNRARRWSGTMPTAYWRVEGIDSDATTLPDKSKRGLGLDGTLGGDLEESDADTNTWNTANTPAGSSQSLYFDGSSNKVTVAYNAALKPTATTSKLSVSFWVKTTDEGTLFLITESDAGTPSAGWVYYGVGVQLGGGGVANKSVVYWNSTGSPSWRSSVAVIDDDEWHHIVHIYDYSATSEIKIYIDGVLDNQVASQSGGLSVSNNVPILMGYRAHTSANYYQYYLDEIAYFSDIALTGKQVKDLYNNGKVPNSRAGVLRS